MEPIRIIAVIEREISRTAISSGDYEIIIERKGIDQYGHEWHNFHRRVVSGHEGTLPDDAHQLPDPSEPGSG